MSYNILLWPDVNYEPGHWRPVMSMAQKVRREIGGCRIGFLCTPECEPIIRSVNSFGGNEIIPVLRDHFPVGYSTLASEKPEEARSRIDHCLKIVEEDGEFDNLLKTFKPDLLIAGYFVSMEALLIQHRYNQIRGSDPEMKIIITTTFLRHPNEDPAITSLRFLTHHAQEYSSKLMQAATGGDTAYDGSFSSIQKFISPLETVTELITCPKELDHNHFEHRKNTHYVEPCILDTGSSIKKDPSLIYASAGSRVRDYVESARTMFRTLYEMINIAAASSRQLEMAVGYTLKEEFAPTNKITILDWANQTDCLKRARSAVIHGGLATIKECIYFGIAPIVIPLGKDQMDNALRVVDKEVGSMVMLDKLTDQGLYNAIMKSEGDSDIQKSLGKMRDRFKDLERSAPSIQHIKQVLGIQS